MTLECLLQFEAKQRDKHAITYHFHFSFVSFVLAIYLDLLLGGPTPLFVALKERIQ